MGAIDILWHLLNFVAPAVVLAVLAAATSKWLWRRRLARVPLHVLSAWAGAAAVAALLAGLVAFGRDGGMSTYALMAAGGALALWWRGFMQAR